MREIDAQFGRFTPDYYDTYQRKAYDLAAPDIEEQYKRAVRDATYTLARGTGTRSSAGAGAFADLKSRRDKAILEAQDRARGQAAAHRSQIFDTRNAVVSQLNATADPYAAANAAANQAQALTQPPMYSPIAGLFADLTGQFAQAQAQRRAGRPGWGFDIGTPGLGGSRGSVSQGA